MLKPFQIRDLHGSPSQGDTCSSFDFLSQEPHDHSPRRRPGIVQLSASDYDELASSHPRARLTYMDDDDGDIITVGSSFELSQRLDEPIEASSNQLEPMHQSTIPEPMHIFDIRRSNSVTELWKKFEHKPHLLDTQGTDLGVESTTIKPASPHDQMASSPPADGDTGSPTNDDSESLLAAFEAEMAKIIGTQESHNSNSAEETSSNTDERNEPASSDKRPNPTEAFSHVMHSLINGAELIGSEVRSRLPELEHQLEHHLQNAQRALPENVGSTVQAALTTLESQVRNLTNALNNASVARGPSARNIFQGEIPTPAQTVESLCSMASEIGQIGHTLFSAFENEFDARNASTGSEQPAPEAGSPEPVAETQYQPPNPSPQTEKETKIPPTVEDAATGAKSTANQDESLLPGNRGEDSGLSQPGENTQLHGSVPHHSPSLCFSHRHRSWRRAPDQPYRRPHHHHHHHYSHVPQPVPHQHPRQPPPPPPHHQHPHPDSHPHPQPHGCHQHRPFPPPPPHPIPRPFWQAPAPFLPQFPSHPAPQRDGQQYSGWPSFSLNRQNDSGASAATTGQVPHADHRETDPGRSADAVLFIGNVGFNVNEKMIRDVFAAKGFLAEVHLPLDSNSKKHAGFGYLHFPSIHAASAALDALQGTHIDGHSINLEFSDHSPIRILRADQRPEPTNASGPSELESSTVVPATNKAEMLEVKHNDARGLAMAKERQSIPLSVTDLCSSDKSAHDPKGKEVLSTTPDDFPRLTRNLEQSRFPPVSQLDAHVLTHQRRDGDSTAGQPSPSKLRSDNGNTFTGRWFKSQGPPGSFPEDDSDERRPGLSLKPTQPRRSKSMKFSSQSGIGGPAKPLRRRATELHSLRNDTQNSPSGFHDMACAYDNYSSTFGNSHPRNAPLAQGAATLVDDDVQQADARQRAIDDCVTALFGLGYGNTNAGGYQRMAVYAAAADGRVSDAIEMIEEERKAYELQGSLI